MGRKKCNCCGKEIKETQGILKEDVLEVSKEWGYFSNKDTQKHYFVICEACYDTWIAGFKIPPVTEEKTEILS